MELLHMTVFVLTTDWAASSLEADVSRPVVRLLSHTSCTTVNMVDFNQPPTVLDSGVKLHLSGDSGSPDLFCFLFFQSIGLPW